MKNSIGCIKLTQVINVDILQEIQDKFSRATGLAAVIVDLEGNPITEYSRFTPYCWLIRSLPGGIAKCKISDAYLGRKASSSGKTEIHCCHAGLIDIAAPIIVNGIHMASVLCGQILIDGSDQESEQNLSQCAKELNIDKVSLLNEREKIPKIQREQVQAAADLVQIIANYIVGMGIASVNDAIINEKNMKIMKEQHARIDLEKSLKASELKALQSQVNPHFLFNTLNTIARLAMLENAEKTEEVVFALSDLLRYSLRKLGQLVSLREEINYIMKYLKIQEIRFPDRINFEILINEEIMEFRVPIMTLQPLIENAIVHGLEQKIDGGKISITGYAEDNFVIIKVSDNGQGMCEEKVQQVMLMQEHNSGHGHTTGIGIANVYKRLTHHFGQNCRFLLKSTPQKGTQVTIGIPLDEIK